ncbi:PilW family protein [Alcanivorax sediminis]|uniref:Prepilin-type N-terminal cleavage/methylation domain-containing protein n=1 Tax=Alcanivorax sediminis TaxID=2663008 RepID=A0A6N7M062_9GAMM|nr:PilW family protein [Alcanivorax sediminis]MQX54834.1 prepilin-type N-terminal cleavage/methylation domain-containing protein [Alcanivorax sediminis]
MMTFSESQPGKRAFQGFSLIELMIALLLGSLITLAAVQLFSTNNQAFQLQRGLTDVQEQGRFGLNFVSRQMRMMGYEDPDLGLADTAGLVLNDFIDGAVTYPASAEGGTGNPGNDRLTFSRHGDIGDSDCEGDVLAIPKLVVSTYWVQGDELFCMGNVDAATTGISVISGVDSFQVLAGIDSSPNGVPAATLYKKIDSVLATDQIVTMRLGLVLQATQNIPTPAASKDILILDRQLSSGGGGPVEEPAVRRVFVTTVRIRNVAWGDI